MSNRFMYFLLFGAAGDAGGMIEIIFFICMTKARRIIVKRQQVGRDRNFPAVFSDFDECKTRPSHADGIRSAKPRIPSKGAIGD
jgi:hypothetical protein